MALKTRYSPLQHFSLDNLFTAFSELSPRNKIMALAVTGLVVFLLLFLPLSLVSGKVGSLRKEITTAKKGLSQVMDRIAEYERSQARISQLEKRFSGEGGSLTTRIEGIARESGVAVDQLREKAPQETDYLEINSVEVKLSMVTLPQLMEFLYNLENSQAAPLRLRRLQVRPSRKNRQNLDVSCEVATFLLKKEV